MDYGAYAPIKWIIIRTALSSLFKNLYFIFL
jgi:hypothetical protein